MKNDLMELPAPDKRRRDLQQYLHVKFACRFAKDFKPGTYEFEANKNAVFSAFENALSKIQYIKAEILKQTFSALSFGRAQIWELCYSSFIIKVYAEKHGDRFDYKATEAGKWAHGVCGYVGKVLPDEIDLDKFGTSGKMWLTQATNYYGEKKGFKGGL